MKTYALCTGRKMPALGFGTWHIPEEKLETVILEALRVGFRHFDTAAIDDNESIIGAALRKGMKMYPRKELWITSKLWCDAHKPDDVVPALKKSLHNLRLDYVDLYLMHFPIALKRGVQWPATNKDYYTLKEVPLAETWQAMERCVKKGLVRDIGTSNFSTAKLKNLMATAKVQPAVNQIELHPYQQQHAQRDYAKRHHILLTAYSPLGGKGTTLRHPEGLELPPLLTHPVLAQIANEHNVSTAQVVLAWLLALEVSAIPSSSTPQRIQDNFTSSSLVLTPQNIATISELHAKIKTFDAKEFTRHDSPYSLETIWDNEIFT